MRSSDRRRQLLEVAAEEFARLGYRGTTTARLARAAGISEPILYRHFRDKQELFVTLVAEVGRAVIAAWRQALRGVEDPAERLRVMLAANPATHARGRGVYRVIFQAMTEVDGDPAIARRLRAHLSRLHDFVAEELAGLQERGAVRGDQTAGDLAWLLISVAAGYGMIMPLDAAADAPAAGGKNVQDVLSALLAPPGRRGS
jgi:AcrR family transcriptional regulator